MAAKKKTSPRRSATKKTPAASAGKIYTCRTCGRTTTDKKHLCNPGTVKAAYTCEYCGVASTNPRHLCKPKVDDAHYYCDACGRISVSKNLLCMPKILKH